MLEDLEQRRLDYIHEFGHVPVRVHMTAEEKSELVRDIEALSPLYETAQTDEIGSILGMDITLTDVPGFHLS